MEVQITLDIPGAYNATGVHLMECAKKNNYLCPQDFSFRKTRPATFSYFDMAIRYKNRFYAILMDIRHNDLSIIPDFSERKEKLIKFCQGNNLVPCMFPLDMSLGKQNGPHGYGTYFGGGYGISQIFTPHNKENWNLFHAETSKLINPSEGATDELTPMSEYEKYYFATDVAKKIVEEKYGKIVEWYDVLPGNDPQLVYINKHHNVEEWCCVRVVNKPISELTESELAQATKDMHIFNPIFSHNGLFFLIYIEKSNDRTALGYHYKYKIKESFRTSYEIID